MVYRVYVEKKPGQQNEANSLRAEIQDFLQIHRLTGLRLLNRYDVENIDEQLFTLWTDVVDVRCQPVNAAWRAYLPRTQFA